MTFEELLELQRTDPEKFRSEGGAVKLRELASGEAGVQIIKTRSGEDGKSLGTDVSDGNLVNLNDASAFVEVPGRNSVNKEVKTSILDQIRNNNNRVAPRSASVVAPRQLPRTGGATVASQPVSVNQERLVTPTVVSSPISSPADDIPSINIAPPKQEVQTQESSIRSAGGFSSAESILDGGFSSDGTVKRGLRANLGQATQGNSDKERKDSLNLIRSTNLSLQATTPGARAERAASENLANQIGEINNNTKNIQRQRSLAQRIQEEDNLKKRAELVRELSSLQGNEGDRKLTPLQENRGLEIVGQNDNGTYQGSDGKSYKVSTRGFYILA